MPNRRRWLRYTRRRRFALSPRPRVLPGRVWRQQMFLHGEITECRMLNTARPSGKKKKKKKKRKKRKNPNKQTRSPYTNFSPFAELLWPLKGIRQRSEPSRRVLGAVQQCVRSAGRDEQTPARRFSA